MEIVAQDNTRDKLSHEKEKGKLILASPPSRIHLLDIRGDLLGRIVFPQPNLDSRPQIRIPIITPIPSLYSSNHRQHAEANR